MILSSLLMEMAAAPFNFWFREELSEELSWMNLLMLLTWQKLAPMSLAMLIPSSNLLINSVLLSDLVGAMGGLHQISLRKLMVYSLINHMSWMLMAMNFLMYSFLPFILIFMFNNYSITMTP